MWAKIVDENAGAEVQDAASVVSEVSSFSSEDEIVTRGTYTSLSLNRDWSTLNFTPRYVYEETYGWDSGPDKAVAVQNAIKRFKLRKLKSPKDDSAVYYGDKATYFLWRYEKNAETGEELLVRPDEEVYRRLRVTNNIRFEPFLSQPNVFW